MTTDRTVRSPQHAIGAGTHSPPQNAALRGAALAFGKPPVKPKPNLNTYSGNDSALAAARGAGRTRGSSVVSQQHEPIRTPERQMGSGERRISRQTTGESGGLISPQSGSRRSPSRPHMARLDSNGFLQPGNTPGAEGRSPSFIAATLAASRSASISPNVTGQSRSWAEARAGPGYTGTPSPRMKPAKGSPEHVLDTTPIPPTNALIGLFEKNAAGSNGQAVQAIPRRTQGGRASDTASVTQRDKSVSRSRTLSSPTPRNRQVNSSQRRSPPPPAQIVTGPTPVLQQGTVPQLKPKPRALQNSMLEVNGNSNLVAPTPVRRTLDQQPRVDEETRSRRPSERRPLPPSRRDSPQKYLGPNSNSNSSSHLSLDSANNQINAMANAIVASSIASSRAASPAKQTLRPPPPPPSRRSARGKDHFFHSHKDSSRTPSPTKQNGLRTTMRKPRLEEEPDEGEKRRTKKHNIMKKHPNKHAEGDRKRWRDAITERERKRYEAVWASNKGLHVFPQFPGSEYAVCNLVVKDIFSRSRLHLDVLEEVYTLVDRKKNGNLEREEFVVGLWLIDQRLKGRKLPIRVSDHVWRSVGGLHGIKVKKAYKG